MTEPRTCAEEMRQLADWLDVADPLIDQIFELHGRVRTSVGDAVQQDLRAWASYLEYHPLLDLELWMASRDTEGANDG